MNGSATILPSHRILVLGKTRSGKSTLLAYLFSLFRVQKVLIDPKGEWVVRGAVTVRSPEQLTMALEKAPVIRYVPSRSDKEEWEAVYGLLFEHARTRRRPLLVWTDEATSMTSANYSPTGLRLMQTQGAGLGLGHMAASQRPYNIGSELRSETEHFFVFGPPFTLRQDMDAIATELGLSRDELRDRLAALPRHGFLWWVRDGDELVECDPLPGELRRAAGASARKVV